MNAYANKNTGKLLVAILAMAMVIVGAAVVLSDREVNAANPGDGMGQFPTAVNGTITLTQDVTLTEFVYFSADITTIEGNGYSIIDNTSGIEYAIASAGTITFNDVVFETTSTYSGEIINTTGISMTFNECEFHANENHKAVQVYALSGAVTFNSCNFDGSEVVYNDAGNGTLSFTNCIDVTLSIAMNSNTDGVTIDPEGAVDITIDSNTTLVDLIIGWNFGNGWAASVDTSAVVTVGTDIDVDQILAGVDSVSNGYTAGTISVSSGSTISASYSEIEITGEGTKEISEYDIYMPGGDISGEDINKSLEDYGAATINSNTNITTADIVIDSGETLYIDGCKVSSTDGFKITVNEGGTLVTDNNAYVYIGVDVKDGGSAVVNDPNVNTSDGGITSDTTIGFGDTLTLTGNVPSNATLTIYGTLNTSDLTVTGAVKAYVGSTVNITGTVNVSGTFDMTDADMTLEGTVNVNGTSGAFNLKGDSTVTVAENGVFSVKSGNTLSIAQTSTFTVEGTLNMNGTVSGEIQNKGTINFNGTSSDASIVMYSGVSLTVTSVSGSLTVTDDDDITVGESTVNAVAYDYLGRAPVDGEAVSFGNTVTLTDVGGVTITEEIVSYSDTVSNNRVRSIVGNMTVSGETSVATGSTAGTVALANDAADTTGKRAGTMTVGDMTVGAGVTLTNASDSEVTVTGTLAVTAASTTGGLAAAAIDNDGTITVEGTVAVSNISNIGAINAVRYSVTTEANSVKTTVYYYTTFANALGVTNADKNMLYVVGSVETSGEQTLSAGTIRVERNNTLTIPTDSVLTIASGAKLDISGTVDVNGALIITDNTTGLSGTPDYDVKKTSGNTDTYSGLGYALNNAAEGETITLAKNITLKKDTTIPAGVTLATGRYAVTVNDDVTLTVNGTLAINNSGSLAKASGATTAEIIANGVISSTSSKVDLAGLKGLVEDGAFFSNGNTDYASNVAYAAENIGNGEAIYIQGDVTAGDVTFTAGTVSGLTVYVTAGSTFTAGTVTLDGSTLNLVGTMTGAVEAAAADGTASIQLNKAAGFAGNALVIDSESVTTADGQTDYMYVSGKIDTGSVTIASGTVTVNDTTMAVNSSTSGATQKGTLTVAANATLDIPASQRLVVRGNADNATALTVNGAIDVDGTLEIIGSANVAGTINANDGSTLSISGATAVTGTIAGTTAEGESASISINSTVTLGDKPTQMGASSVTGVLSGTFMLQSSGIIKAYNGADVSGARINPTQTESIGAENTAFYINDNLYMTVYAGSATTVQSIISTEEFELSGYACGSNTSPISGLYDISSWKDADGNAVSNIGVDDAIYATVELSMVGIDLSIGPNLTVYIDNVRYTNGQTGVELSVGSHNIVVQVNPGLTGTTTVQFNGQDVTDGTLVITPEMADAGESVLLSVMGNLAQDVPTVSGGSDDGLGLTDILLIILVVLIVIMAIMVAMRLMRS